MCLSKQHSLHGSLGVYWQISSRKLAASLLDILLHLTLMMANNNLLKSWLYECYLPCQRCLCHKCTNYIIVSSITSPHPLILCHGAGCAVYVCLFSSFIDFVFYTEGILYAYAFPNRSAKCPMCKQYDLCAKSITNSGAIYTYRFLITSCIR